MYNRFAVSALLSIVLIAGVSAAEDTTAPPSRQTPTGPRVLTLKQAQETALRNNPDFEDLEEQIYQAEMAVHQAWSMLLPSISAEANVTRNKEDAVLTLTVAENQPPLEITIQDLWEETVGFNVNLSLLNPQSIPLVKLAYDEAEKQRLRSLVDRNELLFAVTSAYYQAYSMKELVKVAKENLETAKAFLDRAKKLAQGGHGTLIDVNRGELQVLGAQEELADAQDAEKKAMIALKHLLHEDTDFDIVGPKGVHPLTQSLDALKRDALEKRLELREVAVEERMADRSRKETVTKFLPKLDITYAWSWSSTEGFSGSQVNWTLVFGAKWDLFQGGMRLAEYKARQSQRRMVENRRELLIADLKKEVETRYLEMLQHERNVVSSEKRVALTKDNHRLINNQYQAGVISSLDVVDAATELSNQRLLNVYRRLLFDLSVLSLRKAAGEYNTLAAASSGGLL